MKSNASELLSFNVHDQEIKSAINSKDVRLESDSQLAEEQGRMDVPLGPMEPQLQLPVPKEPQLQLQCQREPKEPQLQLQLPRQCREVSGSSCCDCQTCRRRPTP